MGSDPVAEPGSTEQPGGTASLLRSLGWLAAGAGLVVVLAFVVSLVLRDRTPRIDSPELERNYEVWRRSGVEDYELRFTRQLDRADKERFFVSVRGGRVVRFERNGRELPPNPHYTVDGLFDSLRRELEMASQTESAEQAGQREGALVKALFHEELGAPLRINVIARKGASFRIEVDEFRSPGQGGSVSRAAEY